MLTEQCLMELYKHAICIVAVQKMKDGLLNRTSKIKVPLRNAIGEIFPLVCILQEINELMKAQEERERTLFRTLIDNLPDYIYI
jgi:hypothetical protein